MTSSNVQILRHLYNKRMRGQTTQKSLQIESCRSLGNGMRFLNDYLYLYRRRTRVEFSDTLANTIPSTEYFQLSRQLDGRIETVKSEVN